MKQENVEEKGIILYQDKKLKIFHFCIIIIGTIFVLLGAFHTNIWFDESYSVAIAEHKFNEIWYIDGHDVHPVFYYFLLHLVSILTNSSIIAYRLFSVIPIIIMGILGCKQITHDFGRKVGILFSFFSFFLPVITLYASEIRMYTYVMLFVTITAIYANRLIKESNKKNWIVFAIFSLLSAYTHYYGLMAAGIINILLFVFCIKKNKKMLKQFIISAVIQVIIYLPWCYFLIKQIVSVTGGFWISIKFPDIIFETINIQFKGNYNNIISFIVAILMYLYVGYIIVKCIKNKIDVKPGIMAIIVYFSVIFAAALLSIISPILYPRYIVVISGLFIFFVSYFMAKEKKKYLTVIICILVFVYSLYSNIIFMKNNYSYQNKLPFEYLEENIKENDIIIYKQMGTGGVLAAKFKNTKQYFYNEEKWGIKEAYKAYAPQMDSVESLEFLDNYTGRIWLEVSQDEDLYENYFNNDKYKVIEVSPLFITKYKDVSYKFMLLEKVK